MGSARGSIMENSPLLEYTDNQMSPQMKTFLGPGSPKVYHNKSYIPPHVQGFQYDLATYPYGWSSGIESFRKINNNNYSDCTDPYIRAHVERDFVAYSIGEPSLFESLDKYLNIVYSNAIGKSYQWLKSSLDPVVDNPRQRSTLSRLHAQVNRQQGQVLHSKNGLRIVIPKEKWINWKTFSPTSRREFTCVA
jgi:hypothetical protein